jgi:hypothetical protein
VGLAALLAVLLSTGLITGGVRGAGDNNDGSRLYCGAGLVPAGPGHQSVFANVVVLHFDRGPSCQDPVPSSALPILQAAVASSPGRFSLTWLGGIYTLLLAGVAGAGAWAAARAGRRGLLVLLPVLVPLADPTFTRFLISTYSEPAGLLGTVALLAGVGILGLAGGEDRVARGWALGLVAAGGVVAATAKVGYAPLLVVAVAVCALTRLPLRSRPRLGGPAVAAVAVAVSLWPLSAASSWQARHYADVNAVNLTYTVALAEVPRSAAHLGLPAAADHTGGQAYYPFGPAALPGAPEVVVTHPARARSAALRLLVEHPGALLHTLGKAIQATRGASLAYIPERPLAADRPAVERSGSGIGPQGVTTAKLDGWLDSMSLPWATTAVVGGSLVVGAVGLRRRGLAAGFARLAGVAGASTVLLALTAVLGDGYYEIAKHVWLAAYTGLVSALALVGAVVGALVERHLRATAAIGPDPVVEVVTA